MKPLKNKTIHIRLSEKEYKQIEDSAWDKKMKLSEYARSVLLAPAKSEYKPPTPKKDGYELVRDDSYQS